jgi:hypothetical protein
VELVYGAGRIDRRVPGVDALLSDWRKRERDLGEPYLLHKPGTPPDRLVVEDLAVTMLLNSRVAARAAASVFRLGAAVDLGSLPAKALEETTDEERQVVARVIGTVADWPGLGASLATKALHKKQPALIPVLDNQAIFGAYMNPQWPGKPSSTDTVKGVPRIKETLDWITRDLVRPENEAAWSHLQAMEAGRSRIEVFDMIWWTCFRQVEPYGQPGCSPSLRKVSRPQSLQALDRRFGVLSADDFSVGLPTPILGYALSGLKLFGCRNEVLPESGRLCGEGIPGRASGLIPVQCGWRDLGS